MPSSVVKSLAKKSGKTVEQVEAKWEKSVKIALKKLKKSNKGFYPFVVSLTKKMLKLKESTDSFKEFYLYEQEIEDTANALAKSMSDTNQAIKVNKDTKLVEINIGRFISYLAKFGFVVSEYAQDSEKDLLFKLNSSFKCEKGLEDLEEKIASEMACYCENNVILDERPKRLDGIFTLTKIEPDSKAGEGQENQATAGILFKLSIGGGYKVVVADMSKDFAPNA